MKKMTLVLGAASLAIVGTMTGVAVAQQQSARAERPMRADPFGTATITRAQAQAKAGELFVTMDANKDGKLDQVDRQAMMAARMGQRFDALDANKDGKLDKTEFTAARQNAIGRQEMGMRGFGRGAMLGRMDGNGDNTLTRAEFVAGALKRFDAADANKDGKLTPEERRSVMRGHGGKRRMGWHHMMPQAAQ